MLFETRLPSRHGHLPAAGPTHQGDGGWGVLELPCHGLQNGRSGALRGEDQDPENDAGIAAEPGQGGS